MLNPLHLRTLGVVLRAGSFADAARELGYTSSAVSQQIASLERQIRMSLFDRSASSIAPTPVAMMLVDRAAESLVALDTLEEEIHAIANGQIGLLRIGSFPTASERLVPFAISRFHQTFDRVSVQLDEAESDVLTSQVSDRQIDVALVYAYDLVPRTYPPAITAVEVLTEDLILLVPSRDPVLSLNSIHLSDLSDRTWITTRVGTAGEQSFQQLCARDGFLPNVAFRSNDYDVIREFVRAGLGIALIPGLGHTPFPGVEVRMIESLTAHRQVRLLRQRVTINPTVAAFTESVLHSAAEIVDEHLHLPGWRLT